MRSAHRVVCALALTGLLALVYLVSSVTGGGSGAPLREGASERGKPVDAVGSAGPRVGIPAADRSSVQRRAASARSPSEARRRREGRVATAGQRSTVAVRRWPPESNPPPSSDAPIEFDRVSVAPGALSVGVTGVDWGAPRPLVLWRMEEEEHARLASTQSREDGHFDFGQVVVPNRGLELAVTPLGAEPSPADRARGLELRPSELYE